MSTAAPAKGPASSNNPYEVTRPLGTCAVCGKAIEADQKFTTALVETPTGFHRVDSCLECWPKHDGANVVASWQTVMPRVEHKKKVFVDDEVLGELFGRLAGVTEPAKVNFRFVLGLILMRKRLITYDSTRRDGDAEYWVVKRRGNPELMDLLNPRLAEEQVKDVSQQLDEILSQEL